MRAFPAGINTKEIDDIRVAFVRFRGLYEEVPDYLDRLYQHVAPYTDGQAILLHHYFDEKYGEGHDLEICLPVRQAGGINSRILPGGRVLSTTHTGPREARDTVGGLSDVWQGLFAAVRQHGIILDPSPRREVYLEDRQGSKAGEVQPVTELQLPVAFFRLDRLAAGLQRHGGEAVRQQVMQGSQEYPWRSARDNAEWFHDAMERLDEAIDDEGARRTIMNNCADRFPPHRIASLRAEYQRSGDIDELLQIMRADRTLGHLSWYEQPIRSGNVIHVSKDPVDPEAYEKATDSCERRSRYCHCSLMRDLIRSGQTVSGTYCHCGAGWYHQLWEGILGEPVEIDVIESVLQGDDRCSFAIHLP
jgi:effector-binding domain-containing protein